jgi:plastocyanin
MNHPVQISVNPNGHFTYSPSHVRAKNGDTVTFTTNPTQPFEVAFKDKSPGDKLFLSQVNNQLTIRVSAAGIYHYAAAIYDSSQGRVFLDSGCGDVGVEL